MEIQELKLNTETHSSATRISKLFLLMMILSLWGLSLQAQSPVNKNATPEAKALLEYIYSISGKKTMAGQHAAPLMKTVPLSVTHRMTKNYPAVFGQDFGFSYPGYWDGTNFRQRIVDDAILRHKEGFVITLMWHAVPPTLDEPVAFKPGILTQGSENHLTDKEWKEMITPGTYLNEKWKSQVDVVAWFLKQLQYAKIPVLWRPYHEMNGGWFWWGKREGKDGYAALYKMMYDRFTNFHGLNNLLWVYNTNEIKEGVNSHAAHYPGDDHVDILATDVYTEGFNQNNYDQLLKLSGNKPIALGEVGHTPDAAVIKAQPRWAWFMRWSMPEGGEEGEKLEEIYKNDNVIKLYDLPWVEIKSPRIHYPILID